MHSVRNLIAMIVLAGLTQLGGCSYPYRVLHGVMDSDNAMHFEMTGPISVNVDSFNGDVIITTDEHAKDVTLRVEREATHGFLRGGDAASAIKGIEYEAKMVPGELGPELQVRTWTTTPEPHLQRAHIFITTPALQDVNVTTHIGSVRAVNMAGSVDITTHEGDVVVMTNEAMTQPVTIVTSDGTIDYRVRGESSGRFDCETVRGTVKHRLMYGRIHMQPSDNNSLHMTLNDGENPVQLRTVDGDIRIAIVHNPVEVGMFIIEP